MATPPIDTAIHQRTDQIESLKRQLSEAHRRRPSEAVADYVLLDSDGWPTTLSALFGDRDDLIVIHNMGRGCAYCTLWANGFNSLVPHLENRAAFVVVSPDAPEVQSDFAASRKWTFRMTSAAGRDFTRALGYEQNGSYMPGISAFRRQLNGSIVRTGSHIFRPGDDYSLPWRLFDLLEGGVGPWEPRYRYVNGDGQS